MIQLSISITFPVPAVICTTSGIMTIINPNRHSLVSSNVPSVATRSSLSADMIRSRLLFKLGIYDPNFINASIYHKIQRESCFARTIKVTTARTQNELPRPKQPLPPLWGVSREESKDQDKRSSSHEARYLIPLAYEQESTHADIKHRLHFMPMRDKSSLSSSSSLPGEIDGGYISDPPSQVGRVHGIAPKWQSGPKRPVYIRFDPLVTVVPIPSHRSYDRRMRARLYATKDEISLDVVRNTREFMHEGWDWRNVVEEAGMHVCKASGKWVHPAHVVYGNKEV